MVSRVFASLLLASFVGCATTPPIRQFADRQVAWTEHDDAHLARAPRASFWARARMAHRIKDEMIREVDRTLSLESTRPAEDVNALDEVPCSTWFCPRNHLTAMSLADIAAGPPGYAAPVLPLRVVSGKSNGAAPGFVVKDAAGNKFLMKYDPPAYLGLVTGAETIGPLLFHAMGYHVPRTWILEVDEIDIGRDPEATYAFGGVDKRRYTDEDIRRALTGAARTTDGKIRLALSSWIDGEIIGPFDFQGRRKDDANDRIAHEHRRSLRASRLFYAWTAYGDPSSNNTLDAVVEEDGRRFVRHYLIDWGGAFGAGTVRPKKPPHGRAYIMEPGRWLASFLTFGLRERGFQGQRDEWEATVARYPAVGWFPAEGWNPDGWKPRRKVPAHLRMTARDAYWAAKVITSFSDAQIHAVVAEGQYPAAQGAFLEHALRTRRDIIGRTYLTRVTAVEQPVLTGEQLCFTDLAIARGAAAAGSISYRVDVRDDGRARSRAVDVSASGARTCLNLPTPTRGYRIVTIVATVKGKRARAARVHLAWRAAEDRPVVVGVDRDE